MTYKKISETEIEKTSKEVITEGTLKQEKQMLEQEKDEIIANIQEIETMLSLLKC